MQEGSSTSAGEEGSCLQKLHETQDEVQQKLTRVSIALKNTMWLLSFLLPMQRSGFGLRWYSPGYLITWKILADNNIKAISLV